MLGETIAVVVILSYLLAIASAMEAVVTVRTAQGAIAWVIALLSLPYVAVPLYLIFGRNRFNGYLEQRRGIEQEMSALSRESLHGIDKHVVEDGSLPLYTSLRRLTRLPVTRGNETRLLIDGAAFFEDLQAGLRAARRFILFQFYIIRDDGIGNTLGDLLIARAREGLTVRVLYDEIGAPGFSRSRLVRRLRDAGVQVAAFNSTRGRRNRLQLNFRNHRKVVVVDGAHAWIGGHNVGDEYLGINPRRGAWRDTHIRLDGPAVRAAELAFAADWRWATGERFDLDAGYTGPAGGDSRVLVISSEPAGEFETAGLMYHELITSARHRIWITSPYFVPDRSIVAALQLAALRGVDVRLLIPDRSDGPVVALANWAFTRELLPAGVQVLRYESAFMHQKVCLIDEDLAGVGTVNFDNRSFRLNFEITVLVHDAAFCSDVATMLERDFAQARRVTQAEISRKPFWFPLATGAARLLAPVL